MTTTTAKASPTVIVVLCVLRGILCSEVGGDFKGSRESGLLVSLARLVGEEMREKKFNGGGSSLVVTRKELKSEPSPDRRLVLNSMVDRGLPTDAMVSTSIFFL